MLETGSWIAIGIVALSPVLSFVTLWFSCLPPFNPVLYIGQIEFGQTTGDLFALCGAWRIRCISGQDIAPCAVCIQPMAEGP